MRVEEAAEAISLGVISIDEALEGLFGEDPELEEGLKDWIQRFKGRNITIHKEPLPPSPPNRNSRAAQWRKEDAESDAKWKIKHAEEKAKTRALWPSGREAAAKAAAAPKGPDPNRYNPHMARYKPPGSGDIHTDAEARSSIGNRY